MAAGMRSTRRSRSRPTRGASQDREDLRAMRRGRISEAVRRDAALSEHRLGETEEVGRRASQRRRSNESAQSLPPAQQSFVHQDFDRAGYREAANAEPLGQLRFTTDPFARSLRRKINAQPV